MTGIPSSLPFTARFQSKIEHNASFPGVLDFSSDDRYLALGGPDTDGAIRIWDLRHAKQTALLKQGGGSVFAVRFSPDGELLAAASGDVVGVTLWDLKEKTVLHWFGRDDGGSYFSVSSGISG